MSEVVNDLIKIVGKENLLLNEPMSVHTTFKIGGPADIFVTPTGYRMLKSVLNYIATINLPYLVIGKGSNLIVSDKGIRSIVISTYGMSRIRFFGNFVKADCGVDLAKLSLLTARHNLTGLEFASGIPGSVGGAVFMNAGAYEGEIRQVVKHSLVLSPETNEGKTNYKFVVLKSDEHCFSYRHSIFQDKPYIHINSVFELAPENKDKIKLKIDELTLSRHMKQPWDLPSAGSVFKRPEGYYTGKLIQDCGLRGFRIGDAAVSTKHCGFIVNLGKATANDVKSVIEHVQKIVFKRFGVHLQTEVKFVDEE